ncbi:phosphotransferase family protein [Burkholderia ubonensis]|uniref:phosphotransferase family protein n=1 Tax=Burkholderia ubonensis TaxID=101571 RepID=UPI0009B38A24|nr:aminoglycoside phosphotransferase family protein [Burkholderia ubonensis]
MRFQPVKGTPTQRAALRRRFEALMAPEAALAVIRRHVRADAARAWCSPVREPSNRFVVRVDVEGIDGARAVYALKGYADGRGEEIGELYGAIARHCAQRGEPSPVILPRGYLRDEALLVTPWVHGSSLADALRAGRIDVVRHAPRTLAQLHAIPVVPEAATPTQAIAKFTVERWALRYQRFPDAREPISRLADMLLAALPRLRPSLPTLVHGDAGPANFLLDGERWLLLDLDTYGYADPAYDAGYFLAKLEYEWLGSPLLRARAPDLVATMRDACIDAMPEAAAGNVAFFYAMTLIRKVLARQFKVAPAERSAGWSRDVAHVVAGATAALNDVHGGWI